MATDKATETVTPTAPASPPMHLLDITVIPCKNPSKVVANIKRVVVDGAKKANGKIYWLFKIVGENRILAFLENSADSVLDAINGAVGEFINVKSEPLRIYENFAKSINKVDPELCGPSPRQLTPGGRIFFIDVLVNYKSYTQEEMTKAWAAESTMMLGKRKAGELEIDVFKVVGSKRVLTFMKVDADTLDDMSFQVPLTTMLGDNCFYVCSEVTNMLQ